jgi:hypothetical protein
MATLSEQEFVDVCYICIHYKFEDNRLLIHVVILLSQKIDEKTSKIIKLSNRFQSVFSSLAWDYITEKVAKNVVFIPATKSGIYLLRKPLFKKGAEEMLSKKEVRIIKEEKENKDITLPQPIIDFIKTTLIDSPIVSEEFKDLIKFGEEHIIHGSLEYNSEIDEIIYKPKKPKKGKAELLPQIASALVVESIPLLTFLKYGIIKKGSLVILEEPEAHLHPDAQRNLVRLLIRLVNRGVRVLLITHSPYVLQQINNCIMLYRLDKAKREEFFKKHGYTKEDILNPDLVSAYLFELDKKGYSKVKLLEVDVEGIPYDAFYATLMELHRETGELRRLLYEQAEEYKERP